MKSFFELKVTMKYVNCDFIRVPRNKKRSWFPPGDRLFNFVQNSPEVEHFKKELSSVYQ